MLVSNAAAISQCNVIATAPYRDGVLARIILARPQIPDFEPIAAAARKKRACANYRDARVHPLSRYARADVIAYLMTLKASVRAATDPSKFTLVARRGYRLLRGNKLSSRLFCFRQDRLANSS